MPQDRTQAAREGQALFLVDGNLQHAFELVFDRILDGDQLVFAAVDLAERRIQGRGLAAAGRTGDEQHAVRQGGEAAQGVERGGIEAEGVEGERREFVGQGAPVEDAQDGILAVDARHDRDAQVDFAALVADPEPPVLRHATFGDVEFRHDLDAGYDLLGELGALQAAHRHQHAVDAMPDRQAARQRFDMDIARAPLQGVVQRRVDEADHRARIARNALQREFFDHFAPVRSGRHARHAVERPDSLLVTVEAGGDIRAMREAEARHFLQQDADPVAQCIVERIGERHPERRILAQHDAFETQRLAETELVEAWLGRLQERHVEQRQLHRRRQPCDERRRRQAGAFLQRIDEPPARCRGPGRGDLADGERNRDLLHFHWMFSASWKIGR